MEIKAINNSQAFTGFKISNKTRTGVAEFIEDIAGSFVDKTKRAEEYKKYQKEIVDELGKKIIEPLKKVNAEVEYANGRIFVRNANGSKTVELDRGKVAPLHPQEYTVVQYPTKGTGADCCVKVNYGTREAAEGAAKEVAYRGAFGDLIKAREIAKYFDTLDAKALASDAAVTAYKNHLNSLADDVLNLL